MWTVARLRALVASPPTASAGAMGITTFISQQLMRGVRYRAPARGVPRTRQTVSNGLHLGRRLDASFRRFATGRGTSPRLAAVLRSLRRRSVIVAAAQTPVYHNRLRTELDGLGVDSTGRIVILELKNTQLSVAAHSAAYDLPCPNNTTLTNGLPNSERVRHALQAGFGLLAFSHTFRVRAADLAAVVVVNCADGCVSHLVDTAVYSAPHVFTSPSPPQSRQWDASAVDLAAAASRLGFPTFSRTSCRGRVGVYTKGSQKLAIAVGSEHTRWVRSIRSATTRAVLVPGGCTLRARRV